MSADNYLLVRPHEGRVAVTMEFASSEPRPVPSHAPLFDTVELALSHAFSEEQKDYYEYGVSLAPEYVRAAPQRRRKPLR